MTGVNRVMPVWTIELPGTIPPPTEESTRNGARDYVRRSAVYCMVMDITPPDYEFAVLCDELGRAAEHHEIDDNTHVFLGELANGYQWQVRVHA